MQAKSFLGQLLVLVLFLMPTLANAESFETAFDQKRARMVEYQLKGRGIRDARVLDAMLRVKRHLFVPHDIMDMAYEDRSLPIGWGQTISQPAVVALMTELLALKGTERVLEIGTGSGYQAAILAELAREVYTIEILAPLARQSEELLLKKLRYSNIRMKTGDGFAGWPAYAPFDRIIVTCAPEQIPPPLLEQLAEGGRLVIPVGSFWQELKLVRKANGRITETDIVPVRFVPMLRDK